MDVLNVIGLFSDACQVIKYRKEFDRKLQQAPPLGVIGGNSKLKPTPPT